MEIVAGNFKMRLSKFSIILSAVCLMPDIAPARDLEIQSVETTLHGDFAGREPELEARARLKSLSRLVIFEPRAEVVLEAADGRTHRETVLLIPKIEPGFEVNSTVRFNVPPWWSVAEPALRFELLDYRVLEPLLSYRQRLQSGTALGEAVVAASVGASVSECARWEDPAFKADVREFMSEQVPRYMPQHEGFLRIALILGLRRCSGEEAQQYYQGFEPDARAALEEVLQVLVANIDDRNVLASPLARALPPGIRTLEDLFKLPLPKLTKASLTRRYSALGPGEELDRSPVVSLENKDGDSAYNYAWVLASITLIIGVWLLKKRKAS